MKHITTFLTFVLSLMVMGCAVVVANSDLGPISGSWENRGHWNTAGAMGAVCEQRSAKEKQFKVKVYRQDGDLYQELKNYRAWPGSCDLSTADLQAMWPDLGTFVEDADFTPESGGEKATLKRWFIK